MGDSAVLNFDALAANPALYGHAYTTLLTTLDYQTFHIAVTEAGTSVPRGQHGVASGERGCGTGIAARYEEGENYAINTARAGPPGPSR